MAVALSIRVDGIPEVQAMLDRISPRKNSAWVGRALDQCADLTRKIAAEEKIIQGSRWRGPAGPRGGKGKLISAAPHPTKLTSRHGGAGIVGSIRVNRISAFVRDVGSDKLYAPVHEYGGRFHPPRPFLSPALDDASEKFSDIFVRELDKELP
jgi:hypothetical protein